MAIKTRKRILSERAVRIVLCVALYASLVIFIGILFLISENYQKIYKSSTVSDGKIDFTGVELQSRDVACTLAGEWEFFYHKWIVTDGYEGEPDGFVEP